MDLMISENGALTQAGIDTLTQAGVVPKDTPPAQIALFAQICKEQGLSAFSKEIYLVGYGGKYTPIVGINGLCNLANRTGTLAGVSAPLYDMKPDGSYKTAAQYKAGELPITCTIIIKKVVMGVLGEFTSTVVFKEFKGSGKWATMPFQMIAKVAEAHAIRKAYTISGVYVEGELPAIYDTVESTPRKKHTFDKTHAGWNDALKGLKVGSFSVAQILEKYEVAENILTLLQNAENENA